MELFAHNGIDHKTSTEAAAHQTNTFVWVVVLVVLVALIVYVGRRVLARYETQEAEEEDEKE